ncbi:hypothetical protein M3E13_14420 [Oceanobacillus kimchii]|uniref:hypothetical protein n=1 Tax=Oceanobacillus kimchii TaxID=746691 RepID=UPI0021A3A8C4|nr:hypothetical protein [Oceanobacillus kimchii]MCT1577480.1 hypothetical protein [Oceanobacillus kimchii]MCT2137088.1 hypothetical protein [Oceanobacillus kimchii]
MDYYNNHPYHQQPQQDQRQNNNLPGDMLNQYFNQQRDDYNQQQFTGTPYESSEGYHEVDESDVNNPYEYFNDDPNTPGRIFPGGGFPGGGFPGGGGQDGQQAPTSAPPSFTPEKPAFQTFAVDPGGIRRCLFRFTYIWPERGRGFWYFPTFVGRNSIAGFRWSGFRWVYFGMDLGRIESFQCY